MASWRTHVTTWTRFFLGNRLGPYVPMPPHVATALLAITKPTADDTLVDLGCGDGTVLRAAAIETPIRNIIGYELNNELVAIAQSRSAAHPHITVVHGDARDVSLTDVGATIVTLYLSENGNNSLRRILTPWLLNTPNARIASFWFEIPTFTPIRQVKVSGIPIRLFTAESIQK